jgi:hypothetical protein
MVRLTNGMFGTLLMPESTVTRTVFAAITCGEGVAFVTVGPVDAFDVVEPPAPPPPPPPPQALTSNASSAALNMVMNVEV